jgi:predicted secreted protein|tara:strand:+ start:232 stop:456 length:225 start_codon:yes stop_codon:yes gene_type:complete
MLITLKKLIFLVTFNISLFLILMIGIQNSSIKKKVNLLINETVSVPISFLIGISFITGSLTGSVLSINFSDKNN